MRTSTAVLVFGLAGISCATSDPIDPATLRGPAESPFADSGPGGAMTGAGGGQVGDGGATGTGGFVGNGGIPPTGGAHPTGGAMATGGQGMPMGSGGAATGGAPPNTGGAQGGAAGAQGGAAGSCSSGEKTCNGACVRFGPSNGCSASGCTACSMQAPPNGVLSCNAQGQCDFSCLSGFTKSGSNCVSSTSGGDGGACVPSSCPACLGGLGNACCKSSGGCGCSLLGFPCA